MDYLLLDERLLDKFHVVNRIRSPVQEIFDIAANVRTIFFRVQDYYQELP